MSKYFVINIYKKDFMRNW